MVQDLGLGLRVHVPKKVYTLAPKYLYRNYIKAKVYTIWVHGPLDPKRYRALIDPFK